MIIFCTWLTGLSFLFFKLVLFITCISYFVFSFYKGFSIIEVFISILTAYFKSIILTVPVFISLWLTLYISNLFVIALACSCIGLCLHAIYFSYYILRKGHSNLLRDINTMIYTSYFWLLHSD